MQGWGGTIYWCSCEYRIKHGGKPVVVFSSPGVWTPRPRMLGRTSELGVRQSARRLPADSPLFENGGLPL